MSIGLLVSHRAVGSNRETGGQCARGRDGEQSFKVL